MSAPVETTRANGRCSVAVMADGSQITSLSVHVSPDTGLSTYDYPAEGRVVLHVGVYLSESVAVFIHEPDLARLIDVLNEAYTRLRCYAEAA